jgi:hypothetical protein
LSLSFLPVRPQPFGATYGYGLLFCDQSTTPSTGHLALFGQDATCSNGNFTQMISQRAETCAQSNVFVCGASDARLPAGSSLLTQQKYITMTYCDGAACATDDATCATSYTATDKCQSDYSSSSSTFGECNAAATELVETSYTTIDQCTGTGTARTRTTDTCVAKGTDGPAYYGAYVKYGCGTATLSSATTAMFSAPMIALAAVAALVFGRAQ